MDKQALFAALNELIGKVYMPTFLTKLASNYNIRPQSPADVANLLQIAMNLNSIRPSVENMMKQATASSSPVSNVIGDALNALTKIANGVSTEDVLQEGVNMKNLIHMIDSDPSLFNAAMLYGLASVARK
ncbi:MAG: hypothetical protein QXQ37_04115 [Nitrososphaerota archaeon]